MMISGESYLRSLEIELLNGISKLSLEIPNPLVIYKIVLFNETHTNTNKLTNWINFVVTRVWGINVLSFVVQKVFKGNSSRPVQRGLNNPALEFPNWVWKSQIPGDWSLLIKIQLRRAGGHYLLYHQRVIV